jgi:hypothetical protein
MVHHGASSVHLLSLLFTFQSLKENCSASPVVACRFITTISQNGLALSSNTLSYSWPAYRKVLIFTKYGTTYSLSIHMGPIAKVRATRVASIAVQHAVEVLTSFPSFGMNKSLFGSKCVPVLPGLLVHR